jgi:hypothetical protein
MGLNSEKNPYIIRLNFYPLSSVQVLKTSSLPNYFKGPCTRTTAHLIPKQGKVRSLFITKKPEPAVPHYRLEICNPREIELYVLLSPT